MIMIIIILQFTFYACRLWLEQGTLKKHSLAQELRIHYATLN